MMGDIFRPPPEEGNHITLEGDLNQEDICHHQTKEIVYQPPNSVSYFPTKPQQNSLSQYLRIYF
jgi:hypothetical protein